MRIVLAEDHYLVREGVRQLLESSGEVEVVAAVENPEELMDAVGRLRPDAVITDIRMPPAHAMEGIDAAHRLHVEYPNVGVVVLSQHASESYAVELLKNGARRRGYLLKDRVGDLHQLLRALREVVAGRSAIDPQIVEALVGRRARVMGSPLADLTPRELDVLRAMAEGRSNPGIAQQLVISESAVEKHITSVFLKLGLGGQTHVHRRVAAVLTYLRDAGE
ncbi:MAG TPA: response regulator transcription factor [Solirubrobacteraceae bacterium]|nr:response regulator transcription factor [Solirubrobacteraceae bacterium]